MWLHNLFLLKPFIKLLWKKKRFFPTGLCQIDAKSILYYGRTKLMLAVGYFFWDTNVNNNE